MPRPEETAELSVGGQKFRDWTSVVVQRDFINAASAFTFALVEPSAPGKDYSNLKLKCGDFVVGYLAGQLAISGYIEERQAVYDARQTGIQVAGASKVGDAVAGSAVVKGGQFRGYPFAAIARSVLKPFGIDVVVKNPPKDFDRPFEDVSLLHGESAFRFLERLARQRGVHLRDDENGNLVAGQINPKGTPVADLEEGRNIISARCRVTDAFVRNPVMVNGQNRGSDTIYGDHARGVSATATDPSVQRHRPMIILAEEPGDQKAMQDRADREMSQRIGSRVEAEIVVQGWLQPDGQLWQVGSTVQVKSPRLFPNSSGSLALAIQGAAYSRSEQGTFTALRLVLPEGLALTAPRAPGGDVSDPFTPSATPAKPSPSDVQDT